MALRLNSTQLPKDETGSFSYFATKPAQFAKKRKEASATDIRTYRRQFTEAKKAEIKSWQDNNVYEIIDIRKHKIKNYITGRWVLTVKINKMVSSIKLRHDGS